MNSEARIVELERLFETIYQWVGVSANEIIKIEIEPSMRGPVVIVVHTDPDGRKFDKNHELITHRSVVQLFYTTGDTQ